MKRIYLVDVSSLIFRAFYAVRPLTSPAGLPVNAIYGFLSMLLKLMKEEKPELMVFCYDRKEPSFRKEIYQEYKANRSEMPEDLVPQMPYFRKLAELMGIPALESVGFEADDLIGTLAKRARREGYEVYIVSGDKDFAQLVDEHTWLYDTMKNTRIGLAEAKEKWGVRPDQMIDYLAIVGDSSDNVPGVKGIGPKGAKKMLEQFETLDGIYQNLDQLKGSTLEKMKAFKDNAYLSQKLVTIVTNCEVPEEMQHYHLRAIDQAGMKALMAELNFKGFEKSLSELPTWSGQAASSVTVSAPVVAEPAKAALAPPQIDERSLSTASQVEARHESLELENFQKVFKKQDTVYAFRHEIGFVFAKQGDETVYLVSATADDLGAVLNQLDLQWKGFDLKTFWHYFDLQDPKAAWDAALAAYVVRAGESTDWNQVYARTMGRPPRELPTPAEKMQELRELELRLDEQLASNRKVYLEQDLPLSPVLYKMEKRGIALDQAVLAEQSADLGQDIRRLEKQIHEAAKEEFNIGSPKQLAVILFERLKLPPGKKTKTGYSTDAEVLESLKGQHPIIECLLEYRELTKLKSTYVDALPALVKADGRIHTTFDQALTMTGRLSSVNPNLQNIPIRTERGARVRKAFVAAPGQYLLSVDYSQIELRVLAHYSNDPNLIQAFRNDLDIHAATASEVFGVPLEEVTGDQRRAAKAVNFGIAYGQGSFGLAAALGIPMGEAKSIIERYFKKFPGVQDYIQSMIESAKERGFVETLSGRRRYMTELQSNNNAIRKFGERAAINAPIQGTAADLMKLAMIELDQKISAPMILQVHDELIFEDREEKLREEAPRIVRIMENVIKLQVPLKANWAIGPNWDEAH